MTARNDSDAVGNRSRTLLDEVSYAVLLPVWQPLSDSLETYRSLQTYAADPQRLRLIGTRPDLDQILDRIGGERPKIVEVTESPTVEVILDRWWEQEDLGDLICLKPGILVPPFFDIRLQWSAYASPYVGAVSPLCDVDPLTSLERHGIVGDDFVSIDRTVSAATTARVGDLPFILPECFFLRRDQLKRSLYHEVPVDLHHVTRSFHNKGVAIGLAPHVFVDAGSLPRRSDSATASCLSAAFADNSPLRDIAHRFFELKSQSVIPSSVEAGTRPRVLVVTHSLGGGLERWCSLYEAGASDHDVLFLRSVGDRGRFGSQIWLFDSTTSRCPIGTWELPTPIPDTSIHHLAFAQVFSEVLEEYSIDSVVVASLIGHSLDVFESDRNTVFVCHDYYPFCPALHIHFGDVCTACEEDRLQRCLEENHLFEIFDQDDPEHWLGLRRAFLEVIQSRGIELVAPTGSVLEHYRQLVPDLHDHPIRIVPHADPVELSPLQDDCLQEPLGLLRVVVLGRISYAKGERLLTSLIEGYGDRFQFFLVGCGDHWPKTSTRGVTAIPHYAHEELQAILQDICPDVAFLLSIVPESFSHTLGECFAAGIPPLATRIGAFKDRIEHGVTGFLCDPEPDAIAAILQRLAEDRSRINEVKMQLRKLTPRTPHEMAADYSAILRLPRHSDRAYFDAYHQICDGFSPSQPRQQKAQLQLPPGSPLGFSDFLRQVEEGTLHHLEVSPRLSAWQRPALHALARGFFRALRFLGRLT
jgi:glycosyltransferase involved in cell wall biosynthesis